MKKETKAELEAQLKGAEHFMEFFDKAGDRVTFYKARTGARLIREKLAALAHESGEPCENEKCQECCEHNEHDHGVCMDCEKDITDDLVCAAEYAYEGDR